MKKWKIACDCCWEWNLGENTKEEEMELEIEEDDLTEAPAITTKTTSLIYATSKHGKSPMANA